jgi:hypothetical protein
MAFLPAAWQTDREWTVDESQKGPYTPGIDVNPMYLLLYKAILTNNLIAF